MVVPTLLITGTVGAGKSAVASEINDVLGEQITVCRLDSSERVRLSRLSSRMPEGPSRDWHLRRSVELDAVLDRERCEDFVVDNDARDVRDVALDVLIGAKWIDDRQAEVARKSGGRATQARWRDDLS